MTKFSVKIDDEYKNKVTIEEIKESLSIGHQFVDEFMEAHPGYRIDHVTLDIHGKDEIECPQPIDQIVIKMHRKDATPGQSDSITIKSGVSGEVFDDDLPHIDGVIK